MGANGVPVPVDSSSLIKLDMPELDFGLADNQPRRLEIRDKDDFTLWRGATLEKVLPDSTVLIRYDSERHFTYVVDLTQLCYRWIYDEERTHV